MSINNLHVYDLNNTADLVTECEKSLESRRAKLAEYAAGTTVARSGYALDAAYDVEYAATTFALATVFAERVNGNGTEQNPYGKSPDEKLEELATFIGHLRYNLAGDRLNNVRVDARGLGELCEYEARRAFLQVLLRVHRVGSLQIQPSDLRAAEQRTEVRAQVDDYAEDWSDRRVFAIRCRNTWTDTADRMDALGARQARMLNVILTHDAQGPIRHTVAERKTLLRDLTKTVRTAHESRALARAYQRYANELRITYRLAETCYLAADSATRLHRRERREAVRFNGWWKLDTEGKRLTAWEIGDRIAAVTLVILLVWFAALLLGTALR